jgi:ComEC/Rec2-related protein
MANKKATKICNFRPLCFLALFVAIVISATMYSSFAGIIFIAIIAGGLFIIDVPYWFKIAAVVICSICCIVIIIITTIYSVTESPADANDLTGVVENYNERYIVLRNVKFGDQEITGFVQVWLLGETEISVETTEKITIGNTKIFRASATAANINNKIRYTANVYPNTKIMHNGNDGGLRSVILRYAKWNLANFLSAENTELVYAMLFGDKSGLDDDMKNGFAAAGLSHALAVSGLHTGLVVAIILLVLKLCKCPKRYRIYFLAPVLLFYAYLCGFRYSILRATIMFLTYYLGHCVQQKTDPLSTLSLAAIIILILFPYSLLSASFLLSFACVFGIILYYDFFKKYLYNSAVAMYLAVTIATLPLMFYYFGYLSVFGIVAAVVLLPILVFAFYVGLLSVLTLISGALLFTVDPLLSFVQKVTTAIANMPVSKISISNQNYAFVFYYVALIIFSRFVFLKKPWRWGIGLLAFACYFITFMF